MTLSCMYSIQRVPVEPEPEVDMLFDMRDTIPMPGDQFGPWKVLAEPVRIGVACSHCGARRRVFLTVLLAGKTGRCRHCLAGSKRTDRAGESSHPLYRAWASMRHRCGPTAGVRTVRRYYARGIRVCQEWEESYEAFRDWALGAGWQAGLRLQLDRVNNDLGYAPDNCRFVSQVVNNDNRAATRRLTAWGETKLMVAWVHDPRCVVDYHCLADRLFRSGGRWTTERAMSTPKRVQKNNSTGPRWEPVSRW